jgi:hypothetical protein
MEQNSRKTIIWVVAILLLASIIIPLYFAFDPTHSHLAPKCMFHMVTGLDCPSCGNQRALHQLLNGNIWLAFRYNPFLWVAAPYIALLLVTTILRTQWAEKTFEALTSSKMLITYLVIYFAWWIVRNLPFWHALVDLPQ